MTAAPAPPAPVAAPVAVVEEEATTTAARTSLKRAAAAAAAATEIEAVPITQLAKADADADAVETKKAKTDGAVDVNEKQMESSIAPSAEPADQLCADEAGDDESIYPDTEEFYAWIITGESGPFMACHRATTVECALPASKSLIDLNVTSVIAEETETTAEEKELSKEEEEIEDMKDLVNASIDDAFAITLMDVGYKQDKSEESPAEEAEATKAIRATVSKAQEDKQWLRIKVARDLQEGSGVPVTIADFDARQGYIIPKIGFWRYLVEASVADVDVVAQLKTLMQTFL